MRPPLSCERLTRTVDGKYRIALKRAWDDGTVAIVTSGIELLARLALLVPPPWVHTTRYFGVWAPRSSWRRWVVPCGSQATEASTDEPKSPESDAKDSDRCERGHRYRLSWAQALAKVFAVDVTVCPRCGQRGVQQIAVIHDARVLRTMQAAIERERLRGSHRRLVFAPFRPKKPHKSPI